MATGTVPKIMVFRPTWDEFKDLTKYVNYMESQGAHKAGIAKVVPPPEWKPRAEYNLKTINVNIPNPICQEVTGKEGLYQQRSIPKKALSIKKFAKLAKTKEFAQPRRFDYKDLEAKYWKNITKTSPIYGADVNASLFDPECKEWNFNHLNTILDCVTRDYGIKIPGITTPYLYFGMWKTSFAWHTEDMDLYSINYLHFGAPKKWYAIPPEHGRNFENMAKKLFPKNACCNAFLRQKSTIISPHILRQHDIPFDEITQEEGEIIITFPFGYHAGFNHDFNCAEAANFATKRWVEYGKRASHCICSHNMVKFSMETFVKRYQPDKYDNWTNAVDFGPHPEDQSKEVTAAPDPDIKKKQQDNTADVSNAVRSVAKGERVEEVPGPSGLCSKRKSNEGSAGPSKKTQRSDNFGRYSH